VRCRRKSCWLAGMSECDRGLRWKGKDPDARQPDWCGTRKNEGGFRRCRLIWYVQTAPGSDGLEVVCYSSVPRSYFPPQGIPGHGTAMNNTSSYLESVFVILPSRI
jgi:hypothetical protein